MNSGYKILDGIIRTNKVLNRILTIHDINPNERIIK